MNYLPDTHVLIFFGCGYEDKIGRKAFEILKNINSKLAVSQISFWEMAIKINIGKLEIPIGLKNIIKLTRTAGMEIVPVRNSHILYYQSLETHPDHKDPFDRFIISTAICENMQILSGDPKFDLYADIVFKIIFLGFPVVSCRLG